ncbi:hypothetical protein A3841_00960 [Pontibacter flavimaris]|uniref:NodB homology domain-containing protein n=2 Tax=Pontibacter flavimaris TaxID=1797110 RepID=A0A1Q5PBL0_9BACT|nr:hypothetical protein A3841_00960 [Pontibacter flavimaris]
MKFTVRNILGWLLACLLIRLGFVKKALSKALKGEYILSVYFHNPSKMEFEASIRWLQKQGLQFLSVADVEQISLKQRPFPKGGVIITVDDGWQRNEANIVSIAEAYKVPVAIFVSTQPVQEGTYWWSYFSQAQKLKLSPPPVQALKQIQNEERLLRVEEFRKKINLGREAMTVAQVRNISKSKFITIGGHTHSHPILINCTDEQVYFELLHSKKTLEKWTGKSISYFTYPNGNYSQREITLLEELGYSLAFTCEAKQITENDLGNGFMLPRLAFLEGASFAENICRMTGVWKATLRKLKYAARKNKTASASITSPPLVTTEVVFK